jgi:DNA polymerase-3 subunit delta
MPRVNLNSIARQAAGGEFHPVYFFHGEETYLTRQAIETVIERAVDKATADFNYERFYGADMNPDALFTSISTPPMMAARRVILLRALEKASLKTREMLAEYAQHPVDSTVLILAAGERVRIDSRKKSPKWAASLQETAATALFWPLKEPELIRWIIDTAGLKGKKISSQVAYELYARIGDDLARLADELEKLSFFCGERTEIQTEDVSRMTGIDKGGTVFDWVDSLAANETIKSCYIAGYLASHGESAVGSIAAAASHFTKVARIKEMLQAGKPAGEIKKELGLVTWRDDSLTELFRQARQYSVSQLQRALELLLKADLQLKTSGLPDRLILEGLSFRFKSEVAG